MLNVKLLQIYRLYKGLILAQKIISTNKQTNNYKANIHLARINVKISK